MNLIDRAIEATFPGWAVRRTIARQQLTTHRGGIQTRTDKSWPFSNSIKGGTAASRYNQGSRRDRARRVYAEHPIGRSLLKTEVDNVVSSGFTLQVKVTCGSLESDKARAAAFNSLVEDRFEEWLDVADIRGMESGVDLVRRFYRSPRRDGDGGIVLVDRGGESRLQYIPGDLICNPNGRIDGTIIDGIEVDAATRPRAFHVLSQDEDGRRDSQRVPANNFIYLAPEIDDDLAIRGDTCYTTIFPQLDQIDGYLEAVTIAARMAAIFGLIFKEESAAASFNGLGQVVNSAGKQQKAVTLENGMLKYQGTADSVVQVQAQQPMQQTPDFVRVLCRLLGLPFDMPLELVFKDLSQTSFSSARIGLIGYYRACRARQKAFIRRCLSRIYRWWLSRELKLGRLVPPAGTIDALAHKFMAEGWDYTDPVSELQADGIAIDLGLKSPQQAAAERGRDWEELQLELKAAAALRRAAGLPDVGSSMTRDRVEVKTETPAAPVDGVDPELARIAARADSYGIAVRAGAITPQTDDEESFRADMKLPMMSEEAKAAWAEDKGIRRPITLRDSSAGSSPFTPTPAPTEEPADGQT